MRCLGSGGQAAAEVRLGFTKPDSKPKVLSVTLHRPQGYLSSRFSLPLVSLLLHISETLLKTKWDFNDKENEHAYQLLVLPILPLILTHTHTHTPPQVKTSNLCPRLFHRGAPPSSLIRPHHSSLRRLLSPNPGETLYRLGLAPLLIHFPFLGGHRHG